MIKDKIQGCLIGGAIGDALGYQIEFDVGVHDKQVTKFKDDFGLISDDTQMTLFTANALLWQYTHLISEENFISPSQAVYCGYLDWYNTQKKRNNNGLVAVMKDVYLNMDKNKGHPQICWLRNIPELNKRRAPGNTCLSALRGGTMGTMNKPVNSSKGCGSVMRIAPCGIFESDTSKAGLLAAECAAITHGNELGWIASYICAAIVNLLVHGDITIEQALLRSIQIFEKDKTVFYENENRFPTMTPISNFMTLIDRAIYLSKQKMSDVEAIKLLGEGWHADDALAIALYSCLKYPNSFEDTIICAANHDGDSDSTAAIAGNIVGASLGLSNIPSYYINNVELKNVILEIAYDLYSVYHRNNDFSDTWKCKYINCSYGKN